MSGRTKVYAMAPLLADELRAGMKKEFMRDQVVTAEEAHLLVLVDGVCTCAELSEQRVKVAMRVLGGGYVDRGIIASIRSLLRQALQLMLGHKKNLDQLAPVEADERQAA